MAAAGRLVILLDLDNTLLDNDTIKADLDRLLADTLGETVQRRFWETYEDVRRDLDVVSFPVTMRRVDQELPQAGVGRRVSDFLMRYPYRKRLFPGIPAALRRLSRLGTLVILSDGEPWFQTKKIEVSGLDRAVAGNVMLFKHKEHHLDEVRHWYPAVRYVFVDDKPRLIGSIKARLGADVTTVWVRQGSYAAAGSAPDAHLADVTVQSVSELPGLSTSQLLGLESPPATERDQPRRAPALAR
jgi:hypothetical protein